MAERFDCEICSKSFNRRHSLKCHQSVHDEKKNSCTICDLHFSSRYALYRHRKRFHPARRIQKQIVKPKPSKPAEKKHYVKCGECSTVVTSMALLIKHLKDTHKYDFSIEKFKFTTRPDFETWKNEIQTANGFTFVSHRGRKKMEKYFTEYFYCHRTGMYDGKANSWKLGGEHRVNFHCSCFATARTFLDSNEIIVTACLQHYGHVKLPTLNCVHPHTGSKKIHPDTKRKIVRFCNEGRSNDWILDELHFNQPSNQFREPSYGIFKREDVITRQDVKNIRNGIPYEKADERPNHTFHEDVAAASSIVCNEPVTYIYVNDYVNQVDGEEYVQEYVMEESVDELQKSVPSAIHNTQIDDSVIDTLVHFPAVSIDDVIDSIAHFPISTASAVSKQQISADDTDVNCCPGFHCALSVDVLNRLDFLKHSNVEADGLIRSKRCLKNKSSSSNACIYCTNNRRYIQRNLFNKNNKIEIERSRERRSYGSKRKQRNANVDYRNQMVDDRNQIVDDDGFRCKYCSKLFKTVDCLKYHENIAHDAKHTCSICGNIFTSRWALYRHKNRFHDSERRNQPKTVRSKQTVKCGECSSFLPSVKKLCDHLKESHQFDVSIENYAFKARHEFDTWKKNVEASNQFLFVCHRGKKKIEEYFVEYLYCNRAGYCDSKKYYWKKSKAEGTYSVNCCAFATVRTSLATNEIHVIACLQHYGHDSNSMVGQKIDENTKVKTGQLLREWKHRNSQFREHSYVNDDDHGFLSREGAVTRSENRLSLEALQGVPNNDLLVSNASVATVNQVYEEPFNFEFDNIQHGGEIVVAQYSAEESTDHIYHRLPYPVEESTNVEQLSSISFGHFLEPATDVPRPISDIMLKLAKTPLRDGKLSKRVMQKLQAIEKLYEQDKKKKSNRSGIEKNLRCKK